MVEVAQPIACCGEIGGIGGQCLIGDRRVGTLMIVIANPIRDLRPSVIKPEKQGLM
jgi:hypothetical protein